MPVVMRERFKTLNVALVRVEGEIIQQALDFLDTSNETSVVLMIGPNGDCLGIDTSIQSSMTRRISKIIDKVSTESKTSPSFDKKASISFDKSQVNEDINLKSINEEILLQAVRELISDSKIVKFTIVCEHLGIPKSAANIRIKVSRVLSKLVSEGKLVCAKKGFENIYSLSDGRKSNSPTEDGILALIRPNENFLSVEIGDKMNYDRKDSKNRIQITKILNGLIEKGMVEVVGTARGIMKVYRLK